ncbi:MAG: alpha-galactosidase [Bacteroidales bacterium]|nr:alpha-galactosidase [Bacteroidales bacterium]
MIKLQKSISFLCGVSMVAGISAHTPTMGWSSWNTYRNNINEDLIRRQADMVVEKGLKEVGYRYINIDDGAFNRRTADGHLNINQSRFPNGLKSLVEYIHNKGLKAGTYSDAGRNTCASYYDNDEGGKGTGLYGHDYEDLQYLLGELDFDFIKVDFCGGDPPQNSEKFRLDEQTRYSEIAEAIKAVGKENVRYNVCRWNYPGTWVSDVASSWRISEDIWPGWESVKGIISQNLYLSAYAGGGKFNDMDMLEVGRGLTEEEEKTHFGMWCMMASPLLIGCDLTNISDTTLSLLSNPDLIALDQDQLGKQAYVAEYKDGVYLLTKDIKAPYSLTRAIAVYNPGEEEKEYEIDFSKVDLEGPVKVYDCFSRHDTGIFPELMKVNVPPHSTRIFTVEGTSRCERQRYEAETAYMGAYQEIRNNQAEVSGIYMPDSLCSGGMKAGWLGKKRENDIEWHEVYSQNGGDYTLRIAWTTPESRKCHVMVNDQPVATVSCEPDSENYVSISEVPINLKCGVNKVILFNDQDFMPDIDYIEVKNR